MSYRDDKPKSAIFPGVAILLAMAGLVGALVSTAARLTSSGLVARSVDGLARRRVYRDLLARLGGLR
jgi:3-hydroxymyristoyl/3-hydroxydecanoyl-(acyl carrier protein) dehydratase